MTVAVKKPGFTKRIAHRTVILAFAAVMAVMFTAVPSYSAGGSYVMATATTGGTYYPVGVAIATIIKLKLEPTAGISMSAISSAGSSENLKLMREKQVQFALLQGLYGSWAWNGTGDMKNDGPDRSIRSISMLWENVEHFIIETADAKTGNIDDLKNIKTLKFSIGQRKSGTEGSGREILSRLGMDPDKSFNLVYTGYDQSAAAMQNGTIKGANLPGGVPVSIVTMMFAEAGDELRILEFNDAQLEKINKGINLWFPYTIPAGTYPKVNRDVNTIAQPNFLAVRADVDEETVYQITKTIYDNLPYLQGIHKATKSMSLERATKGLPVPLHPGAARYFKEKGLQIPPHLVAAK